MTTRRRKMKEGRAGTPLPAADWHDDGPHGVTRPALNFCLVLCLLVSVLRLPAFAQSYSIDWYKVAGGGGASTGATYQVTGTIGQPEASGAMSGGSYSLTGGFWALYALPTPGAPSLRVLRTTTNTVCVWWAISDPAWTLQASTNLVISGSSWTACAYQTNGPNCYYLEAPPAGRKFYRLKQP